MNQKILGLTLVLAVIAAVGLFYINNQQASVPEREPLTASAGGSLKTSKKEVFVARVSTPAFGDAARVQLTTDTLVKATAGGTINSTSPQATPQPQKSGTPGNIKGSPSTVRKVVWYYVNFDTGPDGWVPVGSLTKSTAPGTPTINSFTANPTSIASGQKSTLSWTSINTASCTVSGGGTSSGTKRANDSWITPAITITSTFTLVCTSATGVNSAPALISFAINQPPVVSTGGPYSAIIDTPLTFDGSGTRDNDGTLTNITWNFGDGSPTQIVTGTLTPSHTFLASPASGSYNVTLTVTDNSGATASAGTTVSVPPPLQPAVSLSANPLSVPYNTSSTISWYSVNATKGCTTTKNGAFFSSEPRNTTGISSGNLTSSTTFTITCKGQTSSTDAVASRTVAIDPLPNTPPTVSAGGPYTGNTGTAVSFSGSAFDADGSIVTNTIFWDFGDNQYWTYDPNHPDQDPLRPQHTYLSASPAEGYLVKFYATDDDGAQSVASTTATITTAPAAQYTVSASASPSDGGTVSGTGRYESGSSATLNATENPNYKFSSWSESSAGTVIVRSTSKSYTFTVDSAKNFTANFEIVPNVPPLVSISGTINPASPKAGDSITFTGSATDSDGTIASTSWDWGDPQSQNPSSAGTPGTPPSYSGTHTYNNPGTYTVSFVATDNRGSVSSPATRSVTVNPIIYNIATSSSPLAGGSTSGGGSFNSGSSVTVTATPAVGYSFNNWTEGGNAVSSSASYTFTASGNRTLVANFTLGTYTITTSSSPTAGGTTSGGGVVNSGSNVTVTATAATCYAFVNWTEGANVVSSAPGYTFTASGNRTLVANFTPVTYSITTSSSPTTSGTTSGGGTKNCGSSVTVTATPAVGYSFVNWKEGATVVSSSASYTFTANNNRALTANFTNIKVTITTAASPIAGGTASGGGDVNSGSSVTVTATPASCYTFVNWTEGGSTVSSNSSYTFTASNSRSLVANFNPVTYTVTTSSAPAGGGTTSGGGTKNCGSSVTVTATPAVGYSFNNWTEGGNAVSSSASYTFTASGNRTLVANFTLGTYTITTSSSPTAGGTTSGGGVVNSGSNVTVTATAAAGYSFSSWTDNGTIVSSSASYTFTVTGNRTLVANFISSGQDTEPPVGSFVAPVQGTCIGNSNNICVPANSDSTVKLRARATDNINLSRMEFYIDNAGVWMLIGTTTCSGTSCANGTSASDPIPPVMFDSTGVANGSHTLWLKTYDAAENTSSAFVGITVSNLISDPGVSLWLKEIARPTSGEALGNAVKTDAQGNVIVVGNIKGTVSFSGTSKTALGGSDIYITKTSPTGNLLWAQAFGGTMDDYAAGVTVDAAGNIYVTGYFVGTSDFGGGSMTSAAGIYGSDIFVAKYSSSGAHVWSKRFGGRFGNNGGAAIAVDTAGNVIVAGKFYGEADFVSGDAPDTTGTNPNTILSRAGSADGFVIKLDGSTGANIMVNGKIWKKDFGSIDSDTVRGVAVDSVSGDVVVAGYAYAGVDFGSGLIPNLGSADMFLVKYAGTDGHYLWSRAAGGAGPDTAEGVAVDTNGNIYITGGYYVSMNLAGVTLTAAIDTGIYLAKYDGSGALQWTKGLSYETTGGAIGVRGVTTDSSGNVAITGNASGRISFGNGVASYGDANIYAVKYGPQGGFLWLKRSENVGRAGGYAITVDKDRNVLAAGFIQGDVNIDGLTASGPGTTIKSTFLYKVSP